MDDLIIKKLKEKFFFNIKERSSIWDKQLSKNLNIESPYENFGTGAFTKNSLKNFFYNILIFIIYKKELFNFEMYKKYKMYFKKIDRFIDIDTIRHIYTFERLKKIITPKKVCIIGDGKANGVLGCLVAWPDAKIFSINLPEVLLNDYLIKKRLNLHNIITVLDNSDEANLNKINLISASDKEILFDKNIDLFINIASFQEMTMKQIYSYFEIIRNNKAMLYSCNREYKKSYDGEEIYFKNYPTQNSKTIFFEDCPWHKYYYSARYPFIHQYKDYRGVIKHKLSDFNN